MMSWAVEKDIRLFALDRIKSDDPGLLAELYRGLRREHRSKGKPVEVELAA